MSNLTNAPFINQEVVPQIVKRMVERKSSRPIFFLGKGGIGKTEAIADIAQELNMGYVDVRLLLYTESDLKGVPFVNENHTATVWLQNDILPRVERDGERGILVFDEITSCPKSVRTAAYQLLNERRLGEYVLPDGWVMICLGNGENDGGHFNGMEGNFANRCSVYQVEPSTESWKAWALKNNVNSLVIGYISWKSEHIHTMDPDNESEIVFASPRSWKAVSDILNETEFNADDQVLRAEILANIGVLIGGQFLAFCKFKEDAIEPGKILAGTEKKKPRKQEILYMTIQALVRLLSDEIKTYVENGNKIDSKSIDDEILSKSVNCIKWILSLSALEHRTMGIKDLIAIDKKTMTKIIINEKFMKACPELFDFADENELVFANV